MPEVHLILDDAVMQKINYIIVQHKIFENHEDFIIHALTDLLEEYR